MTTRILKAAIVVAIACIAAAGCAAIPPKASITQTATFDRPPEPTDCLMPVLQTEPLTKHRRIAMVEAWGSVGQEEQVLAVLKSSGCETGADALVIVADQSQVNPATAKFGLPESTQQEEDKTDSTQSERYKKHVTPVRGEAGHPGYYLDSIAIVYDHEKTRSDSASH